MDKLMSMQFAIDNGMLSTEDKLTLFSQNIDLNYRFNNETFNPMKLYSLNIFDKMIDDYGEVVTFHLKNPVDYQLFIKNYKRMPNYITNRDKHIIFTLMNLNLLSLEVLDYFIEKDGLNIIYSLEEEDLLFKAIENKDKAMVKHLLSLIQDVNRRDEQGNTYLHKAAMHNLNSIVSLLNKGIDVNDRNKDGDTALSLAVKNNNKDIVEVLLNNGANVNNINNEGSYVVNQVRCNKDILQLLLDNGADINSVDGEGYNLLMICLMICRDDVSFAKFLIEKGIDLNYKNDGEDIYELMKYNRRNVNVNKYLNSLR